MTLFDNDKIGASKNRSCDYQGTHYMGGREFKPIHQYLTYNTYHSTNYKCPNKLFQSITSPFTSQ